MRRVRRSIFAILVAGGLLIAMRPAIAGASDEADFANRIASERSGRGLRGYGYDSHLADVARRHSQDMANQGRLFHNDRLGDEVSGWQELGENVGEGASVPDIHNAFMASSVHRSEILGDYEKVGIGTAWKDGTLWVTEVFFKAERSSSYTAPSHVAPAPAPKAAPPISRPVVARPAAPIRKSVRLPVKAASAKPVLVSPDVPLTRGRLEKLLGDLVVVPQDFSDVQTPADPERPMVLERGMGSLLWRATASG